MIIYAFLAFYLTLLIGMAGISLYWIAKSESHRRSTR